MKFFRGKKEYDPTSDEDALTLAYLTGIEAKMTDTERIIVSANLMTRFISTLCPTVDHVHSTIKKMVDDKLIHEKDRETLLIEIGIALGLQDGADWEKILERIQMIPLTAVDTNEVIRKIDNGDYDGSF